MARSAPSSARCAGSRATTPARSPTSRRRPSSSRARRSTGTTSASRTARPKRDDDAVAAYKKAIELSPNDAGFHFNLAVALRRKTEKDPDQIPAAIAEYEKATGLDPGNKEGWFDLGYMYKLDHQNDKAIEAFNKYLELNGGKDSAGQKKITEELGSMGATPAKPDPKKAPPKKK